MQFLSNNSTITAMNNSANLTTPIQQLQQIPYIPNYYHVAFSKPEFIFRRFKAVKIAIDIAKNILYNYPN